MSVIVAYLMLLAACFAIAFRAALPPRGHLSRRAARWRCSTNLSL